MKTLLGVLLLTFLTNELISQTIFDPPAYEKKLRISAIEIKSSITIDGKLDEQNWAFAPIAENFIQSRPDQGKKATQATKVRILFNKEYLYIGAICYEPMGKKGINIQDLRRDFSYSQNELFSVTFDPFQDVRNPMPTFQVSPYGNQRDLLIYDDRVFDTDWDAVWEAKCSINDSSWIAEIAIPWSSLRYPTGKDEWGINFNRNIRKKGEVTGWSLWPRAYTVGRMQYGGLLEGIHPPQQKLNLRLLPYVLSAESQKKGDKPIPQVNELKIGGEIKWAVNPSTVADITINTDFAQADVDRQVINLTRSNIYFPERRQFFLENASLFALGEDGIIQPFFSRSVGLSGDGLPVPIIAGGRIIHQDAKSAFGALGILQSGIDSISNTKFGVGRYVKNIGNKLRFGGMLNYRTDNTISGKSNQNLVASADMFWRCSQPFFIRSMVSISNDHSRGSGFAYYGGFEYTKNWINITWKQSIVTKDYSNGSGFLARQNFINTNPFIELLLQKKWLPKKVWFFNPSLMANIYHQADNGKLQELNIAITPFRFVFRNLASIGFRLNPTKQVLSQVFTPALPNVSFAPGTYDYTRYEIFGETNLSSKYSLQYQLGAGGFYDGNLLNFNVTTRVAPIPQVAISLMYSMNKFKSNDAIKEIVTTHLLAPEIRLSINPELQISSFYQYNTAIERGSLNARFSWQYKPLSFIYFVYNSNQSLNISKGLEYYREQSSIVKLSYIKQF
jgi:hypothetical protein